MGGPGAGHKSWRAQEARRINIQKARAARKRAPLPWRSAMESRVIEQLVWQWWKQKKEAEGEFESGGEWPMEPGRRAQRTVTQGRRFVRPGKHFGGQGGRMIPGDWQPGRAKEQSGAPRTAGGGIAPWPAYRLARMMGVSHTWVNKLVKKFEADPQRARKRNGTFAAATLATLERAREETRWQREHGRLRGPMPRRTAKKVSRKKGNAARNGETAH